MNKGYSNLKPNIALQAGCVFSASIAAAGIAPLNAVILSDLPEGNFDLTVEAVCRCAEQTVFRVPKKTFYSFNTALFDCGEKQRSAVLRFSPEDFEIDRVYLETLSAAAEAMLTVNVSADGVCCEAQAPIHIALAREWQGTDVYPEALAAYICPESDAVSALTADIPAVTAFPHGSERMEKMRALVKRIRERSLICAARDSYSPERRQNIKTHDMLCARSATVATSVELAVLFCACAERMGFAPVVLYTTNLAGTVNVFCGIRMTSGSRTVISESRSKVRDALENDELFIFDPAILSSAQSIDVSLAASAAREHMRKAGTKLLLSLDVAEARRAGVSPLFAGTAEPVVSEKKPREVLGNLYTGLSDSRVFRLLNGIYSGCDVIPLVSDRFEELSKPSEPIRVRPMEVSEKPSVFAGLSDDFAAFALKDEKIHAYNKAELVNVHTAYTAFRRRIAEKPYTVAGVYEKSFHERISRMTFSEAPGVKNYMIYGFVRLCERENGETRYLPLCFVEAALERDGDYAYIPGKEAPILNTVLLSYLAEHDVDTAGAETPTRAVQLCERLAAEAFTRRASDFSEIRVIDEAALIKVDLSDFILWNSIRLHARTMLKNKNFCALLTGNRPIPSQPPMSERVLPLYMPENARRVLLSADNAVVFGDAVGEKLSFVVNHAAADLQDGTTLLVTSENRAFLDAAGKALADAGFAEAVLDLSRLHSSAEILNLVRERLEALETLERSAAAPDKQTDLEEVTTRLKSYAAALSENDSSLGISLLDIAESYDSASLPLENRDLLPVADEVFDNITASSFNALFDTAEELVNSAREAQRTAGLADTLPLQEHPLYVLAPEVLPGEAAIRESHELISHILPALSEYRETFFDISDELGIAVSDMKDLASLLALNELYRFIISARELELPADLAAKGFSSFADGADKRNSAKARMENIEYQLRFFSPELFEDVDTLLSDYNGEADGQTNFIKKFLVKKNNKDVLLQYVPPENRGEFGRHATAEIYKLLGEYRRMKAVVADAGEDPDENAAALAALIKAAHSNLGILYPALVHTPGALDMKISALLKVIAHVSSDAALSKKLAYARARFAQVYSENECMLAKLQTLLGADFAALYFENGALNYDGLSALLKRLEENLPALPGWMRWLDAKRTAAPTLPSFSEYLCRSGIRENTDRLFAASLILPAAQYLVRKRVLDKAMPAFERAGRQYPALLEKYEKLAVQTALDAHRQRLKHCNETENLSALFAADESLSLRAFVAKHKAMLFRVFPCILADAALVGDCFEGACVAHTLICTDGGDNRLTFGTFSAAQRVILLAFASRTGYAVGKLLDADCLRCEMSAHLLPAHRLLAGAFGNGTFFACAGENPALSVITVNGAMRTSGDLANPGEAETCVSKAVELAAKQGKRTVLFAFTHGQCAYLRHLLCLCAENDKTVRELLSQGALAVRDAAIACFEHYDCAVVSFAAAADKEGITCRSCGYGTEKDFNRAMLNIACAVTQSVVFVTSFSLKELAKLSKHVSEARALYFAVLFASTGVLSYAVGGAKDENPPFLARLLARSPAASPALGRFACGADAVLADGTEAFMLDCTDGTDLFERLAIGEHIRTGGMKCEMLSPLETVLKTMSGKN